MGTSDPLLSARQGIEGSFVWWLEKLGLKNFLAEYPLQQLFEWGWLQPQYRMRFSDALIQKLEDSYGSEARLDDDEHLYARLWDSEWWIDDTDEPLWFLHPFFRPDDEACRLLRNGRPATEFLPSQNKATSRDENNACPYADYFYHWQGYALIDIVRSLPKYPQLFDTPDVIERADRLVSLVRKFSELGASSSRGRPRQWEGLAKPMTWLSHYRALKAALSTYPTRKPDGDKDILRRGAFELAKYLSCTPEALEDAIKSKLLVLAQNWRRWGNESHHQIIESAWPQLEIDIQNAIEWLCLLTGKTIEDFLNEWKYDGYYGQREWAQLEDVLPYEFHLNKEKFLEMVPLYLKDYNALLPETARLVDDRLAKHVSALLGESQAFDRFVYAFAQMHDALTHTSESFRRIDFSERRPLDYYLMLAITPEIAFRDVLRRCNKLGQIKPEHQSLKAYIRLLAQKAGHARAYNAFIANEKKLTRLDEEPHDRLYLIASLPTGLTAGEDYLAKAFLYCQFARNYFAHHDYLGGKLLHGEMAGPLLSGVLVTLLSLLPCSPTSTAR